MAKRSSEHRVADPEVKVQVRDLVRVVGIVASLSHRGQYLGEICFVEPHGINGHRRPVPGAPSSGTVRESRAKFRNRPCGDCRRVLWVPDPRGQYSGKFVLSRNAGYKTRVGGTLWSRGYSVEYGYSVEKCTP